MNGTPFSNVNNIHVHSMIPDDQKNMTTQCENKENVAFRPPPPAFHDPSSEDCKQTNNMQTRAFLKLDKKYCTISLRAKHLPVKGLIDNRCHALGVVPERRAIHKLNAFFFLYNIKSECKYIYLTPIICVSTSYCFKQFNRF